MAAWGYLIDIECSFTQKCIDGVVVSVLTSSAVDRVKPKTIKLVFVGSPLSTQH